MTSQHRRRLSFGAALGLIVLSFSTAPVFASEGPGTGLAVLALSAPLPLIALAVIASVWSANDRESAKRTGASRPFRL